MERILFPNKYKKLGWGILFAGFLLAIFGKFIGLGLDELDDSCSILGIAGFFIIINSAEKLEDERVAFCRYKAITAAFYFLLISVLISKIFHLTDFWYHFAPWKEPVHHQYTFLDSKIGSIMMSAWFYFIYFKFFRDE